MWVNCFQFILKAPIFLKWLKWSISPEIFLEKKILFHFHLQWEQILSDLGLHDMFSADADFSAISRDANFALDEVVHMAKIKVNEKGSTAAAATVAISRMALFDEEFICDRPFVFMVYDKTLKNVLFTGVYTDAPESD